MSSSDAHSPEKFDVFISFRGDDTRTKFTSHLRAALCHHNIETYKDYKLNRGDEIWPALATAIENSHISVVVFSENYANSTWCLEELAKILECRKDQGHVVIPVFYEVDPSHVRKQTQSYEKAFAKHERDLSNNESNQHKVSKWKAALTQAANISGWDSRTHKDDSQFIENIVNDVLQKLFLRYPNELKGNVGIDDNCRYIEFLLKTVKVIGIWGMGGMGKTTIAKAIFAKLFPQYDNVCFLANVREESRPGLTSLRDKLFFELLKEQSPKSNVVGSTFIMRKVKGKKVLVVLDDVDSSEQLEYLCGECGDLGPESRLIITTRDRHLLGGRVDEIYQVKERNSEESLKLFSLHAFKQCHPQKRYEDLSRRAVDYAGGVPLALKVLGSYLYSKSIEFWESALSKLEKHPNEEIHNVLKVSYDGLDKLEKEIFLDIAFFFKEEDKNRVIRILDACDFYATSGIEVLLNKALITISYSNRIQMHDLLQEMGLDLVRQECVKDPRRRSRLRDIKEVSDVLKQGSDVVEGISLDLSQIEHLHLSANAFHVMPNLRFLQFYIPWGMRSGNVYLPTKFKPFSHKLRYLEWNGYSLNSLPPKFCAKLLVEIRMPHSHVEKLWDGMQDLVNLLGIDLCECKKLTNLPDLSRASKLKWVNLSGCGSLCDLHPSVLSLDTLETLILDRCKNLKSLKSEKHLRSLEKISVNGCKSLKEFSVSSDLIERLDLSNTGIEILHPSIGRLSNLRSLNLEGLRLEHFLDELSSLTSLKELRLSGIELVIDKQKLHVLFEGLRSLQILHLKDCCNLSALPGNISVLSSLHELRLDGSGVERLPASIKHLRELEILSLENCRKLLCIPELSPFIKQFYGVNCMSLVIVTTLKTFAIEMKGKEKHISFENSMKLDVPSLNSIMDGAHLTMMSAAFHNVLVRRYGVDVLIYNYNSAEVCFPGSRVPEQFTYRTTESSITIELPSRSYLLGFIFSVVLSPSCEMKKHGAKVLCRCNLAEGTRLGFETMWHYKAITELNSDHVYVWYDPFHCDKILRNYERRVRFEFCVTPETGGGDGLMCVKECGVCLIHGSEFYNVLRELDMELGRKVELGLKVGLALDVEQGIQWELASKLFRALDKESELEAPLKLELESRRRATLTAIERSDRTGIRTQIRNQEADLSEKCSSDWIVVTESKLVTVGAEPPEEDTGTKDHFSDVEESIHESAWKESKTSVVSKTSAERGHGENTTESTKAVKSKGNKGMPTASDCGSHETIEWVVHSDIHDLTVEEPDQEKENEPTDFGKPEGEDESDEDPLTELESILSGTRKSSSKAAHSTSFVISNATREALQNLECLLKNSLESILSDVELQRQLRISLQCIEQASDEEVSPSVAKLVESMTSSIEDLFKNFALTQKEVKDHTSRLQQKEKLVHQMGDAKKRQQLLNEQMSQYKSEAERLDKEAEELDEKIRLLVERKKTVETKQNELKKALEECDGEKKKLKNEAKNWVMESKGLMWAIKNSESSYAAALTKQEKLNDKWEGFKTTFADTFKGLS